MAWSSNFNALKNKIRLTLMTYTRGVIDLGASACRRVLDFFSIEGKSKGGVCENA